MTNVLLAASEAVPFAKTGGLADVVGSLPQSFDKENYDVRVIMPKYGSIPREYTDKMIFLTHINVSLGWRNKYCGIFKLEHEGIIFYFIDNEFYFSGIQLYSYIHEDIEKFAFFSKAVLSVLPHIDFRPDILHCNDWQTGLIPVMLNVQYKNHKFYNGIKTIMTIHNLQYQGIWGMGETYDATGLPIECFTPDKMEYYNDSNLLKGGLVYADHITTVSNTYIEEVQTLEYGEGLDGLLRSRKQDLSGILNGISYTEYNPSTDDMIYAKYDRRDFPSKKKENKITLQRQLGLNEDKNKFLIGLVSRLTDQKGFDLIAYLMNRFCEEDMQLVLLGTGDAKHEDMFRYYANTHPGKISANILFSNELAHKIYAASDAFLMPSLFEPCGLSQLISMRYGTVPIVRETGGLKDTVIPFNKYTGEGTGFSFTNYNADELWSIIRLARETYKDKTIWNSIARQGMAKDYSWQEAAKQYASLYKSLTH
ncbi:MAG: glycogen synthase GlgA [Clostridiales bacterium]|nr:glycogen synthase GlgA [Clostridiales bacterium]